MNYYLKANFTAEPLFCDWYSWTWTTSTVNAALLLKKRYLKILKSYLDSPEMHFASASSKALQGGPFLHYQDKANEVSALIDKIETQAGELLALADDIAELQQLLDSHTSGKSLLSLYQQVPASLKGMVELGFDINHNPSYRLIEPLLYKRYDLSDLQSFNCYLIVGDKRRFALSNPRFSDGHNARLKLPFDHTLVNQLMAMRTQPGTREQIEQILVHVDPSEHALFWSFFDEVSAANNYQKVSGDEVRVKYFGHACVLIESADVSILVDPLIAYNNDATDSVPRYGFDDLPDKIDYVLITHNHMDHVMYESLIALRPRIGRVVVPRNSGGTIIDPSLKLALNNIGFDDVIEVSELESLAVPCGEIIALPFFGEHGDLHILAKSGYAVRLNNKQVLCLADSNVLEPQLYQFLTEQLGVIDLLFIGMECAGAPMTWVYGPVFHKPVPRPIDQSRRLDGSNCDSALALIEILKPLKVVVYAMGAEPWLSHITNTYYDDYSVPIVESSKLIDSCAAINIECTRPLGRAEYLI